MLLGRTRAGHSPWVEERVSEWPRDVSHFADFSTDRDSESSNTVKGSRH
jgi:hypothetical protein